MSDSDADTYTKKFEVFENGKQVDWCIWRKKADDLAQLMGLNQESDVTVQARKRHKLFLSIMEGKCLETYQKAYEDNVALNTACDSQDRWNDLEVLEAVINDTAKAFFPNWETAIRQQKSYIRNDLFMGDMLPKNFADRVKKMNDFLIYFPRKDPLVKPKLLDEEELVDVISKAKKPSWLVTMMANGKRPDSFETLDEAVAYYTTLHQAEKLEEKLSNKTAVPPTKQKSKKRKKGEEKEDKADANPPSKPPRSKPPCKHCGKVHPGKDDDCWKLAKNANKRPKGYHGQSGSQVTFTLDQFNAMCASVMAKSANKNKNKNKNKRKRKVQVDSSDDEDDEDNYAAQLQHSLNSDSEDSTIGYSVPSVEYAYPFGVREQPKKKHKKTHYCAEIIVEIVDRNGDKVPIRALLDTGTSATLLLRKYVQQGRAGGYRKKPTTWQTLGGNFTTHRKALVDFKFPELSTNKMVQWVAHIDHVTDPRKAAYDMIIGMDLMTEIGIFANAADKIIQWEDQRIPLKEKGDLRDPEYLEMLYELTTVPDVLFDAEERQSRILDANYEKVDIDEILDDLDHLSSDEKSLLKNVLESHPTLFGGGLGTLNINPVHLELKEGAVPYHARPFPVPQSLRHATKTEMDRLTKEKVFEKNHDSEWAAPTFVQRKKTGDPRILTDFRRLNAQLKRKPFPLPKINDLLQRLSGFKYATALDLSMGYYHIPLDEESSKLCTTILPWGKYRYRRLPMGIKNSPDIFQAIMQDLLGDLEFAQVYLDDILIATSDSWEEHLEKLNIVLQRLEDAGFRANLRKCFFGEHELEYLGYWLTRQGIAPQPKKVEAILRITPPKTKRQLRHFLGMVNYYRDMWQRRSHMLAPLTKLVGKTAKFVWGLEEQRAFEEVKRVISKETLLAFPDFDKEFHIYTDASQYQLGAVIMQDDKPLAFYSRKLNDAQKRYPTGEQELLSIVETLKEFRNILLGQRIIIHTDHKNIVYGNLSNDRIARWRLLLEECGPEHVHVAGKDNIVADALSRVEADFDPAKTDVHHAHLCACAMANLVRDESCELPEATDMEAMAETFITNTDMSEEQFPMNPVLIKKEQLKDNRLQKSLQKHPELHSTKCVEGESLITFQDKIVVPSTLQGRILAWYHEYLAHPGMTRLEATLRATLIWPDMRKDVERFVRTCRKCQFNKKQRKKYGLLPLKKAEKSEPWNRVDVDMIGPWTVTAANGTFTLQALTMIDPATGWFEIKDVPEMTADECQNVFDDVWLCRYPRPEYLGYDGGSEFKGVFAEMRANYGMKGCESSPYNPQANGIIERVHQVLADALKTFELSGRELDTRDPWSAFLAAAAYAIWSTFHTTLQATPAQLVFGRDMLLPIKFKADWAGIKHRRQAEMRRNNERENRSRVPYKYRVNDKVLLTKPGIIRKLATPRVGPYTVTRVNANGTLRIRKGAVTRTVNIRRVTPYFER